jgi:hypothetical protein
MVLFRAATPERAEGVMHGSVGDGVSKVSVGCLVLDECGVWALAQGSDLEGVWAGSDESWPLEAATGERRKTAEVKPIVVNW